MWGGVCDDRWSGKGKVMLKQGPEWRKGASAEAVVCVGGCIYGPLGVEHSRPLGPPWCGPVPGLFEERQGSQRGWRGVRVNQRAAERGQPMAPGGPFRVSTRLDAAVHTHRSFSQPNSTVTEGGDL